MLNGPALVAGALFLVAVIVVSALPGLVAPAPGEPEPALLERLEQLRQVARQTAAELWPGWDPTATPLAIYKGTELGVLLGHPAPPSNFRRLAAPGVSAPVFVADSTAGMVRANTAQPFAGALTAFLSYQDFMGKPAAEALATAVHELFHAHQNRIAPRKFGNILVVLWGWYPEFSARNRALLALEAQMLHRAVTARDPEEVRQSAAGFLGLRAERRKDLTLELARYESGEESSEGLARYIEWRLLQLLPRVGDVAPGFSRASESALPAALKGAATEAAQAAEKRLEPLLRLQALERDRERFYALGMAQAALLDRLRPGWKKEFESGPLLLDELLAASVSPAPEAETARLMEQLSYRSALGEQEKAVAERREQGARKLTALVSSGGERVVVEVGAVKDQMALRGFNPNGTVALSPGLVLHTFLLLDLGAEPGARLRLEFRGVPAVYEQAQDALWCMLPGEAIAQALEAYTRAPAAGPARLALKAEGFSGEFTGVEVERRARELRIRPARELKRAPALKPPEFIRPEK